MLMDTSYIQYMHMEKKQINDGPWNFHLKQCQQSSDIYQWMLEKSILVKSFNAVYVYYFRIIHSKVTETNKQIMN